MKNWIYEFDIYTKNSMTAAKSLGGGNEELEKYLLENKMKVKSMSVVTIGEVDRVYLLLEPDNS